MICPYCQKEAKWCENKEVYGKNYGESYMMYYCKDCNAYVGCHNNSRKSLGTLADKELRGLRMEAKNLWIKKELGSWELSGHARKGRGYKKLFDLFGKNFHFGSSTKEECKKIIEWYKLK